MILLELSVRRPVPGFTVRVLQVMEICVKWLAVLPIKERDPPRLSRQPAQLVSKLALPIVKDPSE